MTHVIYQRLENTGERQVAVKGLHLPRIHGGGGFFWIVLFVVAAALASEIAPPVPVGGKNVVLSVAISVL